MYEQESPPAWTQEAYRSPCIKHSICCLIPRGYPIPGPILRYPLSWSGWGVPHPRPGDTPSQARGYPIPARGYPILGFPHPNLAGGIQSLAGGTPSLVGGGSTLSWVPPSMTGVPPRKGPGTSHWGTPTLGKDTEPVKVLWNGDGVPLREWTDKKTETITFLILRMRAVKMFFSLKTNYHFLW